MYNINVKILNKNRINIHIYIKEKLNILKV